MKMNIEKSLTFMFLISLNSLTFAESNHQDVISLKNKSNFQNLDLQPQRDSSQGSSVFNAGYQGNAELGYGIKSGSYGYNFLKLNAIYGYRINPYFYLGLGTGLRLYFDNNFFGSFAAYPVIPFFADFRANFITKNVSPFLSLDVGYSFDASDSFKGLGILLDPAAGLSFLISDKLNMNFSFGYDVQLVRNSNSDDSIVNYGAVSINLGIIF